MQLKTRLANYHVGGVGLLRQQGTRPWMCRIVTSHLAVAHRSSIIRFLFFVSNLAFIILERNTNLFLFLLTNSDASLQIQKKRELWPHPFDLVCALSSCV